MATKIAWTGETLNPFPGCNKISPGCLNCYAEKMAARQVGMKTRGYDKIITDGHWNGHVCDRMAEAKAKLDKIKKPGTHIFVQSMGDFFHPAIPDLHRDSVISWALNRPRLVFQILTKRIDEAEYYYQRVGDDAEEFEGIKPPLFDAPNIWLGVTCENQEWLDRRVPVLLRIPAAVRFLSLEPLLGPLNLRFHLGVAKNHEDLRGAFDWVIVGCESGPHRRPCKREWVESILKQCHEADVPVFLKQFEIDGKVVHDAHMLADYFGYEVEQIRQWPRE